MRTSLLIPCSYLAGVCRLSAFPRFTDRTLQLMPRRINGLPVPPTHSLMHSLTHPLTHSPTHPLTHSLTHPLTHSLTHSLHCTPPPRRSTEPPTRTACVHALSNPLPPKRSRCRRPTTTVPRPTRSRRRRRPCRTRASARHHPWPRWRRHPVVFLRRKRPRRWLRALLRCVRRRRGAGD